MSILRYSSCYGYSPLESSILKKEIYIPAEGILIRINSCGQLKATCRMEQTNSCYKRNIFT